jgi:putative transposase
MPNTYSQIHIQFVFAVKYRHSLIVPSIRERVEKYIAGIVKSLQHKMLAIYCMPDHTHLLAGVRPHQSMADLMREVKSRSSEFINKEMITSEKFSWQEGYGAFSYSQSQVADVINYVRRQPEHHRKKSFREEYVDLLNKFEIGYEDRYLFNWLDTGATPTEPCAERSIYSTKEGSSGAAH